MIDATENQALTAAEGAKILRVTGRTLRKWAIVDGKIAARRVGRKLLFRRDDVLRLAGLLPQETTGTA
jgi:excisionase family DNA binding protein